MGLKALKIVSTVLTVAGSVIGIVAGQVDKKLLDENIAKKVADALNQD